MTETTRAVLLVAGAVAALAWGALAPRPAAGAKPGAKAPPFRGHNLPRLRGVMLGTRVEADDLRELGTVWKANHARWQLLWGGFPHGPADKATPEQYDRWIGEQMARLDRLLPVCREAGILVTIDLHTPPGGREGSSTVMRLFREKRWQEQFVRCWERFARRYRSNPAVWAYDLLNEPVWGRAVAEGCLPWRELAIRAARAIRRVDPERAIIVEPGPWGAPRGLATFQPLPVRNVVYSVHMYQPHKFTHQGIQGNPAPVRYPGQIQGKHWDKAALREVLRPVVEFQRKYNAHIYIGEFSAIRWAPDGSAERWLRDVIDIMEGYEWDWAYHAWREWHGWSVEHGPDRSNTRPVGQPTARKKLLLEWFAKNRKPF